jgi:electron transport complex protein RnfG
MVAPSNPTAAYSAASRVRDGGLLVLILCAATALIGMVANLTRNRIEHNDAAWLAQKMDALVPSTLHDNDLLDDVIEVSAPDFFGTSHASIYRAMLARQPQAAIIRTIAPDGYRGPIELLVAIRYDGVLIGVQVIRHHETPGLGDAFETSRPDWLAHFAGASLTDPPQQRWRVHKDGGDFDEFTGATITPRAIIKATRLALEYYGGNRDRIFAQKAP